MKRTNLGFTEATQDGNSVYIVAVQAETKDLAALTPAIQQILSSYKIL